MGIVVSDFVIWCDQSYLCLNELNTKYLSIDFRRKSTHPQPTVIHNETVESVDYYKYLGSKFDSKLKFCTLTLSSERAYNDSTFLENSDRSTSTKPP